MEELIPIASKLQDVLGALGQTTSLEFPQIVVVGGQSSGKSSVLESIVGCSFLPRGQGIVTRRPLLLTLITARNGEEEEWGEFTHLPGKLFRDFAEIQREIIEDTNRLTGSTGGIHSSPISLTIYSPNVLANLTLVDLPGMTRVAIGDQPQDIGAQIERLCLKYVQNPKAIILAVTSAGTDLANSDALQLAQQVDPHGDRTVGVLTKLDLMDPGTDAVDILSNQVIPLRRYGHVGVVNRGQKDVIAQTSIQKGQEKEELFFAHHPVYSTRANSLKLGTRTLVKMLNQILLQHLRTCLPQVKTRISIMMSDVQSELDALGESPTTTTDKSLLNNQLLTVLSQFTTNFCSTLDGTHTIPPNGTNSNSELSGGARIRFIFQSIFGNSIGRVTALDGLTEEDIRRVIGNANGIRASLFVPEQSFDILVRQQISRLEAPGLQCVDLVYQELTRMARTCEPKTLSKYPNLKEVLYNVVNSLLQNAVQPTQLMVSNLIKIEMAYINTSHPDFIGGSNAVANLLEQLSTQEKQQQQQQIDNEAKSIQTPPQTIKSLKSTPVSSSSLDQYPINNNDHTTSENNTNSGGIMNFIFRGTATPTVMGDSTFASSNRRSSNNSTTSVPNIVQLPQVPETLMPSPKKNTILSSKGGKMDREDMETAIIKSLLDSYFQIVRKNYIDMVPKTIMYFLVNHVKHSMQNELVSQLYGNTDLQHLMKEADDVAIRRKTCTEMKDLLTKALEIVNEVRDYNSI